jgi:hypothetical protein
MVSFSKHLDSFLNLQIELCCHHDINIGLENIDSQMNRFNFWYFVNIYTWKDEHLDYIKMGTFWKFMAFGIITSIVNNMTSSLLLLNTFAY